MDMELVKARVWKAYIRFLKEWAEEHEDMEHYMSSPPCYLEWFDNEYQEIIKGKEVD